jgi:hypothetical protein
MLYMVSRAATSADALGFGLMLMVPHPPTDLSLLTTRTARFQVRVRDPQFAGLQKEQEADTLQSAAALGKKEVKKGGRTGLHH